MTDKPDSVNTDKDDDLKLPGNNKRCTVELCTS